MTNNKQIFFKNNTGRIAIGALALVILISIFTGKDKATDDVIEVTAQPRTVSLHTISADNGTAVKTADGSAFIVRTQSGGRVDRVAKVGDAVAVGATVAQLENSAQRAALIQAEGVYDAAIANSASGDVGSREAKIYLDNAKTAAKNANDSAFGSAQTILFNTVDVFFSNPSGLYPSLRISTYDQNEFLRQARIDFQDSIIDWQNIAFDNDISSYYKNIELANQKLDNLLAMIDSLTLGVNHFKNEDRITPEDKAKYQLALSSARSQIVSNKSSLQSAITSLKSAEEGVARSEITAAGSEVSLSDAQIKQALGALEIARAAYNKTIIKTPVAGTVTAVSITVGDIINVGNDVVFVASDASQETIGATSVPLTAVKFTPSKAFVFSVKDGLLVEHEVKTGLVTSDSIIITGTEGVTEIVADVRGLKAGDAVVTQ